LLCSRTVVPFLLLLLSSGPRPSVTWPQLQQNLWWECWQHPGKAIVWGQWLCLPQWQSYCCQLWNNRFSPVLVFMAIEGSWWTWEVTRLLCWQCTLVNSNYCVINIGVVALFPSCQQLSSHDWAWYSLIFR
jgi:hypothetical protein